MKKNVFISFTEKDRSFMSRLKKAVEKSSMLTPVVIEDKKRGALALSKLVSEGILESNYFVPILTSNSITSQWVNQEIGFAQANIDKIEIVPIVEAAIIDNLKGFVNNQIQLKYSYKFSEDKKKERANYRKCISGIVTYLECKVLEESEVKEKALKRGGGPKATMTTVSWGKPNRNRY
ncbi:MAG: toll/interleukin-1 receptor domain-containing protein [Chitinophagaceae bacterium]|nr:toll/interleukin-1 receptor domain-containing protein [Chitinophagaceae bacterium]